MLINDRPLGDMRQQFQSAEPFDHLIIDDFWLPEVAEQIVAEFPAYDSDVWNGVYKSALEDKKTCNHWDRFPAMTYRAFDFLMSLEFTDFLRDVTGIQDLRGDAGLHGGGWHAHTKGGRNNIHLDYDIHPKMLKQRKLNIIIYMTPNWQPEWNGGLELWSHDPETKQPREMVRLVENRFNRAVIFDTTQDSWHGLPKGLDCPEGVVRRSMAAYYLTTPQANATERKKALFAPYGEQANDPEVLDLIKKRASLEQASTVYRK